MLKTENARKSLYIKAVWRTKWDSNSRFDQRDFAFENSTEFRASVAKLGP